MSRVSEQKHNELEAFWRAHVKGWRDSTLNQREYCEAHGLPLKRFGNWRAKFRHEDPRLKGKLLYRRGGGSGHMLEPMRSGSEVPYIPSGRAGDGGRRRNFGTADKRRIVEEACQPGTSVSGVAKKYGIGPRLLFQWKKDLMPATAATPVFAEVKLGDALVPGAAPTVARVAPIVIERPSPGIEVDLRGGRRVRFHLETDPETIRAVVALLEGKEP